MKNSIKKFTSILLLWLPLATHLSAQYTPPTVVHQNRFYGNYQRPVDWDNDGDLDFIGSRFYNLDTGKDLLLFENIGNGRLADPVLLCVLPFFQNACTHECAKMGDLNGDGLTDLMVRNPYSEEIFVYLHGTDGKLYESQRVPSSGINMDADNFADMDADGDLDIGYFHIDNLLQDSLRWTENDGTGHFQGEYAIARPAQNYNFMQAVYQDINNDGLADVFFNEEYRDGDTLHLFLNLGGTFSHKEISTPTWTIDSSWFYVKLADLDGDGLPDLVQEYPNRPTKYWYKNLNDGNFSAPIILEPNPLDSSFMFFYSYNDLDKDGDIDIVGNISDTLTWLENDGLGVFTRHRVPFERGLQDLYLMGLGDWDQDGLTDVLCATGWSGAGSVAVVRNLGNGQFAPRQFIAPDFVRIIAMDISDLNGDNIQDILIGSYYDNKLAWYPGLGGDQWGEMRLIDSLLYFQTSTLAADFDGDGDADLLNTCDIDDPEQYRNALFWYENLGNGNFTDAKMPLPGLPLYTEKAWVADMDGDSDLDIVCLLNATTQNIVWIPNEGGGQFGFPVFIDPGNTPYFLVEVTDMDMDNDPDVVVSLPGGLYLYRNGGTGVFAGPFLCATEIGSFPITDIDGDQLPDLVLNTTEGLVWKRNPGAGGLFEAPRVINAVPLINSFPSFSLSFADLNQDGFNDILCNFQDYTYGWIPNLGGGQFGARVVLGSISYGADLFLAEDMNADGKKDLVIGAIDRLLYHTGLEEVPTIRGLFFRDDNENGLQDPGEVLLPGLVATLSPTSVRAVSDGQGDFEFLAEPGQYTLGFQPHPCWTLTTDSSVFHLSVSTASAATVYRFGFRPNLSASRVLPFLSSSQPICGQTVPFWLSLRNEGCHAARARLRFYIGDQVTWESAEPLPTSIGTDEIVWESDTLLQPGQTHLINALINISPAVAGDYPIVRAVAETLSPDGLTLLRKDTTEYGFQVLCSFDPNDKLVNITELPPAYSPDSTELHYTIRFQNTGNFKAFNIRIRDTLDAALDWNTFRPIAASHDYTTTLDLAGGILTFEFRDILLPDSMSNEPESHGFVAFSIRPKSGLAPGESIRNQAGIYFDVNPPVITNWAETKVRIPNATQELSALPIFRVAPNPASGWLSVLFQGKTANVARAEVFDLNGKMYLQQPIPGNTTSFRVDISALPPAVYVLKINDPDNVLGRTLFVKI